MLPHVMVALVILVVLATYCQVECSDEPKQSIKEQGRLADLSPEALAKLPAELLHLVQAEKLSSLSGSVLGTVARMNKEDVVLVGKCALAARTKQQREDFLEEFKDIVLLSERVQRELAACMVHWFRDLDEEWKYTRFVTATQTGSPLLAYLPREFIYKFGRFNHEKFLYHLRTWSWVTTREDEWARKPRSLLRSWAEAMVMAQYPEPLRDLKTREIDLQGFLLIGATPDELSQLRFGTKQMREKIFKLPLNELQARAVFHTAFKKYDNKKLLPLLYEIVYKMLPLLTPAQLLNMDLNHINITFLSYNISASHQTSWATARQLAFSIVEQAERYGDISSAQDASTWGFNGLHYLAAWIHALPDTTILKMLRNDNKLIDKALRHKNGPMIMHVLETSPLSPRQARLLLSFDNETCNNNDNAKTTIEAMSKHLKSRLLSALPAECVSQALVSELPQRVLTHLLSYLNPSSPATFPLYLKIWAVLEKEWVLNSIMENEHAGEFLQLIGTSDMLQIATKLREAISRHRPSIPLPRHSLQLLLGYWIQASQVLNSDWKKAIVEVPATLPGLKCKDLYVLGPDEGLLVLPALGQYLQDSRSRYPRDLQHCGLKSLLQYLTNRSRIQERTYLSLLDTLEPAEIHSVGGYIFAHIPASIIRESTNWRHIVRAVGQLSMPELLEVYHTERAEQAADLVRLVLERTEPGQHGLATLEVLGNLLQFVPCNAHLAQQLDKRAFRLWVEGIDRRTDTALCVSQQSRVTFWHRIIIDSYGHPSNWSAGTLGILGGFLSALSAEKLDTIPINSWTEAADVLNSEVGYTRHFMRLCTKLLGPEGHQFSVTTMSFLRRLLETSNNLSMTVKAPEKVQEAERRIAVHDPHLISISNGKTLKETKFNILKSRDERTAENPLEIDLFEIDRDAESPSTEANLNLNSTTMQPSASRKLTCGALRMAGTAVSLVVNKTDLEGLVAAGEFQQCLEYLGSLELSAVAIAGAWDVIKQRHISVDVRDLGSLLSQADVTTLKHSQLDDLDTVTQIGRHFDNWDQVADVVQLVLESNNATDRLSDELAGALGTLTCGLFTNYSQELGDQLLRPEVFMKISAVLANNLARTPRCPPTACLRGLASIASGPLSIGEPETWSYEDIIGLGIIAAGLTPAQIEKLSSDDDGSAVQGLTADAIRCMPLESITVISSSQVSKLSISALDALSSQQFNALLPEQQSAYKKARSPDLPDSLTNLPQVIPATPTSSASIHVQNLIILIAIFSIQLVMYRFFGHV